jgi:hypothetical protein
MPDPPMPQKNQGWEVRSLIPNSLRTYWPQLNLSIVTPAQAGGQFAFSVVEKAGPRIESGVTRWGKAV